MNPIAISPRPFASVLIANRGEIACRIMRSAQQMGLRTIAVYSAADRLCRHVKLADEAYLLGEAPAASSYLNIAKIIEIAQKSGAEALHPGYGFLSENAHLPEACAQAGIVFIGPTADTMRAMGSKAAARAIMQKAGVPVVPGYHDPKQDLADFLTAAENIKFPLLIKAAAGGGGKAMRVVTEPSELSPAMLGAKREAMASFGDDRLILEKYIERARHIEVQIFGDSQGQIISLWERECTLQRRHQKIIEEAPSPSLTEDIRAYIHESARKAAATVNYLGAGTVEFILDSNGHGDSVAKAYFIEMNTRLQVEHPVTEMITGLDLVSWQLQIVMGEPLPLAQHQIECRGHAVEARLYAEDAARGFLPSTGIINHWRSPTESPNLRIDTGFGEGDCVTPYYDPLLAKIIAHGKNRTQALKQLHQALTNFGIAGPTTNIDFLAKLLSNPKVISNKIDTRIIEREDLGANPEPSLPNIFELAASCAAIIYAETQEQQQCQFLAKADPYSPWHSAKAWTLITNRQREIKLSDMAGEIHSVAMIYQRAGLNYHLSLRHDAKDYNFAFEPVVASPTSGRAKRFVVTLDGVRREMTAVKSGDLITTFRDSKTISLTYSDPFAPPESSRSSAYSSSVNQELSAPMPGTVIAILAELDSVYEAGAPILVLEAMKMEHTIRFTARRSIRRYLCKMGDFVQAGDMLAEFVKPSP